MCRLHEADLSGEARITDLPMTFTPISQAERWWLGDLTWLRSIHPWPNAVKADT